HRFTVSGEELGSQGRENSRDLGAVPNSRDRARIAFFLGGDNDTTFAEAEVEQIDDISLRFADEIPAGHAGVGRTVRDELRDVGRPDEDRLELAAQRGGERSSRLQSHVEPGIVEEISRLVGETSLVWQCYSEHKWLKKKKPVQMDGPRETSASVPLAYHTDVR